MKLYATVTSERASKGQGGNNYLHIEALCGDKNNQIKAGNLYLRSVDNGTLVTFIDHTGKTLIHQVIETKGEKQKTYK